jgi:hypothetical protein
MGEDWYQCDLLNEFDDSEMASSEALCGTYDMRTYQWRTSVREVLERRGKQARVRGLSRSKVRHDERHFTSEIQGGLDQAWRTQAS